MSVHSTVIYFWDPTLELISKIEDGPQKIGGQALKDPPRVDEQALLNRIVTPPLGVLCILEVGSDKFRNLAISPLGRFQGKGIEGMDAPGIYGQLGLIPHRHPAYVHKQ